MGASGPNPLASRKMTAVEQSLAARVATLPDWFHSIYIGDGVWTPGQWSWESRQPLRDLLTHVHFEGAKVLDVGCLDGLWTIEAERRGAATVHAIDVRAEHSGRAAYFRLAAELCGSRAHYWPDLSVYDVRDLGESDFDVVLFLGVYYHLRHPLFALERLLEVMDEGATLVVEGQVTNDEGVSAEFYHRRVFEGEVSNWWVPTVPCLHEWVESSGFCVEQTWTSSLSTTLSGLERATRHALIARPTANGPSPRQPRPMRTTAPVPVPPAPSDGHAEAEDDEAKRHAAFLQAGHSDLPLPPASLVRRVTGSEDLDVFDGSGSTHLRWMLSSAAAAGRTTARGARVLDFGCGCGRLLRHLVDDGRFELTGVDTDGSAVAWVRSHLRDVAALHIGAIPPTELPGRAFDLVIAYSVFTHLDEHDQDAWLSELLRVMAPGGTLLATIHGPSAWQRLNETVLVDEPDLPDLRRRWSEEGFAFWRNDGWEHHFPDWYHTAFHHPSYVEDRWSRWFDVIEVVPSPTRFDQDLVILVDR